jgi:hypothetical protein
MDKVERLAEDVLRGLIYRREMPSEFKDSLVNLIKAVVREELDEREAAEKARDKAIRRGSTNGVGGESSEGPRAEDSGEEKGTEETRQEKVRGLWKLLYKSRD